MKAFAALLFLSLFAARPSGAQIVDGPDTLYQFQLPNHDVVGERTWTNDTARYRYNQLKYYIGTVIPYANAATILFYDINKKLGENGLPKKDRKRYIASREKEMRDRFESQIHKLNETQGVLLIKLIARQTGLNIYTILQDFKGGFAAVKWQTWARLHGLNLNKRYNPDEEKDFERILVSMGYPLPAMYAVH